MAEPPSLLTELLRDSRYPDFIREIRERGLLRGDKRGLEGLIRKLHTSLQAEHHPPGPTVEWLLINRLVRMQILHEKALDSF